MVVAPCREEAENGVVLHGGLYGPPYELPVGQNGGHGIQTYVRTCVQYGESGGQKVRIVIFFSYPTPLP